MQQGIIYVYFKLNQKYIEETYCINKDKPELACHGKCHLTKVLKENSSNNKSEKPSFYSEIKLFKTDFSTFTNKTFFPIISKTELTEQPSLYKSTYFFEILHPPTV